MSTVYAAVDQRLEREVAVKVMSSALSADHSFADRFTREARVAARLSHPNVVSVYDQGSDGSHIFLVMELVRGRTLRELLRERGAMPPALAVSIMEPVLGALAAAHRAGLAHRDVKPENILLADDGAVKVADFGLARAVESDASSTRTGLMMGTVAYCPPEQISRGHADARSDVYSAGVVLFELLTGSAPYTGDSAMAVAYQHVNSEVPRPSERRRGIPVALDEIVQRATSREPSGRPLDAGAMLAELHDVRLDLGLPIVAVPPRPRSGPDSESTQQLPIAGGPRSMSQDPRGYPRGPATSGLGSAAPVAGMAAFGAAAGRAGRPGPSAGLDGATAPTAAHRRVLGDQHTAVSPTLGGSGGRRDETGEREDRPPLSPGAMRRRRARRRTVIVAILILLLGLLTGYGTWWLVAGRYRTVPDVTGLSQQVAAQELRTDGFAITAGVQQEFSESLGSGQVIRTDPGAHSHLIKGRAITLVVSRGPERFTVPNVVGQSFTAVAKAFTGVPGQIVRSDAADPTGKTPAGSVLKTDPAAGTLIKRGQLVTVYVSTGPPVIQVPAVAGQTQDAATQTLTKAGFKPVAGQDYSDTVPTGSVISESPSAGSSAVKFSSVTIVVSKGPEMVTIPDIQAGDDPAAAAAALQSLGLQVDVQRKRKSLFDFSAYVVDRVDPGPGTKVLHGSTVVLYVK